MLSAKFTNKLSSTARTSFDCKRISARKLLFSLRLLCWNPVRNPDGLDRRVVDLMKGTKNWTHKSENCLIKEAGDLGMTSDVFRAHEKTSWTISSTGSRILHLNVDSSSSARPAQESLQLHMKSPVG
jgi:hypothetical protein